MPALDRLFELNQILSARRHIVTGAIVMFVLGTAITGITVIGVIFGGPLAD